MRYSFDPSYDFSTDYEPLWTASSFYSSSYGRSFRLSSNSDERCTCFLGLWSSRSRRSRYAGTFLRLWSTSSSYEHRWNDAIAVWRSECSSRCWRVVRYSQARC